MHTGEAGGKGGGKKGKGSQWEPQEACGVGRAQDKRLGAGRGAPGKQEKVWRVRGGKGKLEAWFDLSHSGQWLQLPYISVSSIRWSS